jgi:hypothetical protein
MRKRFSIWAFLGLVATGLWCACGSDTRLAGRKVRIATVKTVSHYGVTLDEGATPQQVAYVLLRAIRDDVRAKNETEREEALDVQFDLCAAGVLAARNKTSLPRDQFIHNIVNHWAPTVAHYVGDFPLDWESASKRLISGAGASEKDAKKDAEATVGIELADPSTDPSASAVMNIWMARDGAYWRVMHLGFDPTRRSLSRTSTANARPSPDSGNGD